MLLFGLCEVELELLADRHVNIGTIGLQTPQFPLSLHP